MEGEMPRYDNKRLQQAQLLMDSVLADVNDVDSLQLDSVTELADKVSALDAEAGSRAVLDVRKTLLDCIKAYEHEHGKKPSADLIAMALDQANLELDSITSSAASSHGHEARSLKPNQPLIAIRAIFAAAMPFAHYLPAQESGEAPFIIVSHEAGAKTGMYDKNESINGVAGGSNYISSARQHVLESGDRTVFKGKITPVMTDFLHCDQDVEAIPLYEARTQIVINGLAIATSHKSNSGTTETASGVAVLGDKSISFTAQVNVKTGEVTVTFAEAVPENTHVMARAFLNVEDHKFRDYTPEIITRAQKYVMFATPYRSKVIATPEAINQFKNEIGIDPAFEGTVAIRMQKGQEDLYNMLERLNVIGQLHHPHTANFNWKELGKRKSVEDIVRDVLLPKLSQISQEIANANGSHGISHIYVGERMRALFVAMGTDFFEASQVVARAGSYRLGRLAGLYEVYYTPRGIQKVEGAERMLLIAANANNPSFNPVIVGEVSAPMIKQVSATPNSPDEGYWVTGKGFIENNPVPIYAASVSTLDVINTEETE